MSTVKGNEESAVLASPKRIVLEPTTRCNLACRMCVKQSGEQAICEGDMPPATFAHLASVLPQAEAVTFSGIGEPLLHPRLEELIAQAQTLLPQTAQIGMQSNGVLMTPQRARSLLQAGLSRICLSVDGSSPELFSRIRRGGQLGDLEQAFAILDRARRESGRSLQLGAQYVLQRDNVEQLPAAVEWAAGQGVDFFLVTHLLPYGEAALSQSLFPLSTDASRALFQRKRREAEQQGLDLFHYFQVRWKYNKSSAEKRLVRFVEDMVQEAANQGIALNLGLLLQEADIAVDEVESSFVRAEQRAAQCGVELSLPALAPTFQRHCAFVEDGCTFIAWDGSVHPCYYLWHTYSTWRKGQRKPIQAKVFGHVDREDLKAVWNCPEYRSFRKQVVSYEYPYCWECTFFPCNMVDTDAFETDCYTLEVPCGDCPWGQGIVQCLR
ncbi:radical SAM/SPASM domain-containing protein [Desulfohalobium retbaense]|uniref:Radical SAM domain protein n=1 Tax=Desulfohalobium retbaense (strain ATCC 49708 / DSM 5692 / JCM 16813 / HR100) TaxID=485915 RepID=C8X1E3_DESRD|nr:radical SAM/SPASM domain-containing protein [Desulfohalobium retbaense]ACV68240.1 Radical SAM domain protein [Desulfohalobium retbaense DSM 5692]